MSLLIGMLACTALVGCTSEDSPEVNNGKLDKNSNAYVTVKLSMSGDAGSRATFASTGFEDAETEEANVNKAIFYFLDANGQGCADKYVMDDASSLEWTELTNNSVDKQSGAIVVIKNPIATPASLVVLLNCDDPFTNNNRPSLAQIQDVTKETGDLTVSVGETNTNYHIMSNAVYVKDGNVMIGTPITEDNITTSSTDKNVGDNDKGDANCTPVVVSVERLWAKVGMTPKDGFAEPLTAATETATNDYIAAEGKAYDIQAEVTGWWLASKADKTYLVKSLSATYDDTKFLRAWWNDATNKRSYWANMPEGVGYTNTTTWNGANATNATEYCLENTSSVVDNTDQNGTGTATQYAAKAVLKLKVGEEYVPTTFVRYLNKVYTEADFFDLLATNYSNYVIAATTTTGEGEATTSTTAYYFLNGSSYVDGGSALGKTAFTWIYNTESAPVEGLNDYEGKIDVVAPANADGVTYTLAKVTTAADGAKTFTSCVDADITALQTSIDTRIGKVLLWLNGQTYYYTDIIHNQETTEVSASLFGVVRNHLYTLNVTGLQGMGTPAPNGDLPINPERPEGDEYSHISAEVQILSYKVVPTQDVNLR